MQSDTPNIIPILEQSVPVSSEVSYSDLRVTPGKPSKKIKTPFFKIEFSGDPKITKEGFLRVKSNALVHLGDTLYFRAMVRNGNPNPGTARLQVSLDALESSTKNLFSRSVSVSHEWREYKFAGDNHDYFLPGTLILSIKLEPGTTLEISNLRLLDMGDTPPSSLAQSSDQVDHKGRKHGTGKAPGVGD